MKKRSYYAQTMKRPTPGQPSEVWTDERRRKQARSAKAYWSRVPPHERVYRNATRQLRKYPMSDDDYLDKLVDMERQYFDEHVDEILNLSDHRFRALAKRAGIKDETFLAFRSKFILDYMFDSFDFNATSEGDDDDDQQPDDEPEQATE